MSNVLEIDKEFALELMLFTELVKPKATYSQVLHLWELECIIGNYIYKGHGPNVTIALDSLYWHVINCKYVGCQFIAYKVVPIQLPNED